MKEVHKELLNIATALTSLGKQMEQMAERLAAAGDTPASTQKAPAAGKAATRRPAALKKKTALKIKAPNQEATDTPADEKQTTLLDHIYGMIHRSRNGATLEKLRKKTGLESRQISNALYKLTKKGKIEARSRGLYVKKK